MSYISGFMLGASIGKAVHKYFSLGAGTKRVVPARPVRTAPLRPVRRTGRQVPSLVCVSAVPGRRRYRAFALIGNPEAADILQNGLQQVKGVTSVSVNPVVGSILLRAENDDIFRRVEVFLENRFFFCRRTDAADVCTAAPCDPGRQPSSEYKHTLQEVMSTMSAYVYERTHHLFDLRSLVSFILIVRGIRRMVTLGEMPSGPQMLWWAVAILRGR